MWHAYDEPLNPCAHATPRLQGLSWPTLWAYATPTPLQPPLQSQLQPLLQPGPPIPAPTAAHAPLLPRSLPLPPPTPTGVRPVARPPALAAVPTVFTGTVEPLGQPALPFIHTATASTGGNAAAPLTQVRAPGPKQVNTHIRVILCPPLSVWCLISPGASLPRLLPNLPPHPAPPPCSMMLCPRKHPVICG